MKFLRPYKHDLHISKTIGQNELCKLEAVAENTAVKDCPFCGAAVSLGLMIMLGDPTVFIECPSCHIKTMPYPACFDFMRQRKMSLEDRLHQATEAWNRRVLL